jgi:rubrerythrin
MAILSKTVTVFRCNICNYEWQRKKKGRKGKPRICPECKNPRWNKELPVAKTDAEIVAIQAAD